VRVEHLLSHTSGLGSYFNGTYDRMARQLLRKVDDYKPLVAEETLAFEPGTKAQYSNTGMLLAGAVIEAATGRDYFDVVRERVYAKAGMPNSDAYDIDLVVPNLAIGYSREWTASGPRWRANTFEHVIRGGPAGGGYSTAGDLLVFAEAIAAGEARQLRHCRAPLVGEARAQLPQLRLRFRCRTRFPRPQRRPQRRLLRDLLQPRYLPRHRLDGRRPLERGRRHAARCPEAPGGGSTDSLSRHLERCPFGPVPNDPPVWRIPRPPNRMRVLGTAREPPAFLVRRGV